MVYKCTTAAPEEFLETEEDVKVYVNEEDLAAENDSLVHNVNQTEPTNAQLRKC